MNLRRAIDASRHTFSADGGRPLHFLEAIALQPNDSKRTVLVLDVAKRIAKAPDPEAAAREIIDAYLSEPPAKDDVPEEAEVSGSMYTESFLPEKGPPIGPLDGGAGDKRSLDEVERACEALGLAVQYNAALVDVVREAASQVNKLASRMGDDQSARVALQSCGSELEQATSAAGTRDWDQNEAKVEQAARSKGQDPARAVALSRMYDRQAGRVSMSRERFVELGLERGWDPRTVADHPTQDAEILRAHFAGQYDAMRATGHPLSMSRERFVELAMERRQNQVRHDQ